MMKRHDLGGATIKFCPDKNTFANTWAIRENAIFSSLHENSSQF